jgi:hypothetical protein
MPLLALSWISAALCVGCGVVLWCVGGRIVHRAVAAAGFIGGVPAGILLGQALGFDGVPPLVCAIVGAFAGLLLALLAYRFALALTVALVAALAAAVVSAAVIDRGLIASDQARAIAETRAGGFTEALAAVWTPSGSDAATLGEQTLEASRRFWSTLDPPERTLFGASVIASGLAGLFMGFFMHRGAEMAVTATAGSLLMSLGFSQLWGEGSPRLWTWTLATAVSAFVGFIVQSMQSHRSKAPPAAPQPQPPRSSGR